VLKMDATPLSNSWIRHYSVITIIW